MTSLHGTHLIEKANSTKFLESENFLNYKTLLLCYIQIRTENICCFTCFIVSFANLQQYLLERKKLFLFKHFTMKKIKKAMKRLNLTFDEDFYTFLKTKADEDFIKLGTWTKQFLKQNLKKNNINNNIETNGEGTNIRG
jgi:hypothetical protein